MREASPFDFQTLVLEECVPDHLPRVPLTHHLAARGRRNTHFRARRACRWDEFGWTELRKLRHVALSVRGAYRFGGAWLITSLSVSAFTVTGIPRLTVTLPASSSTKSHLQSAISWPCFTLDVRSTIDRFAELYRVEDDICGQPADARYRPDPVIFCR